MARSVTFSEEAFKALRDEKLPGESDSDVLLRLRREAHAGKKDPMAFLRRRITLRRGAEEWLGRMRDASRRDAWQDR